MHAYREQDIVLFPAKSNITFCNRDHQRTLQFGQVYPAGAVFEGKLKAKLLRHSQWKTSTYIWKKWKIVSTKIMNSKCSTFSYHSRSISQFLPLTDHHYTKYILDYNHYLVTNEDKTSLYTKEKHIRRKMINGSINMKEVHRSAINNKHKLLTRVWSETRQSSHTLTRCSKQNRLVTFFFGHLQRPMTRETNH